ncbi:MAG: DNA polymerase IV [Syntrophorhabdaceae bacterium PtaU1.Bin034]|nr:MAG: DNA polymerase IV [Syntrophorhabdaceae bacterium PtaU1.Bin034]
MHKIILCVDMDAFFASVEQRDNPDLRGKPIAVTGAGERTVVTTSSYEARKYGVKTGMTVYEAKRLCPQITLVVGNNRKYARICTELQEICLRFTPDTETFSIDEIFLDVTGSHHLFGGPVELAQGIKTAVRSELGITCTIGIGPNVLIAKLASDLAKPDGLRWIDEDTAPSVLESLPVKKLWGIGSHTEEKLRAMGITTCGQLGRASVSFLTRKFGVIGERLRAMGNGILERPLEVEASEPKSIGHSVTLAKDIWKREEILPCLLRLSERAGRRARRYGYKGKTITLTVRYADFKTFTRQTTLPASTNDTGDIYRSAVAIFDSIRLRSSVRLLGISLSALTKDDHQMALFRDPQGEKRAALANAVDTVNDKFGECSITFAAAMSEKEDHKVISPAWRPSGVRKSDV